ncbi:hypothetical protein [Solimonas flava]|uniref:hypothetical protein n=1 Tax=Solimonas flava TaxID=415849 RepID=UPI00041BEBFF|nr:hypothetical protein [Solimonas flava]
MWRPLSFAVLSAFAWQASADAPVPADVLAAIAADAAHDAAPAGDAAAASAPTATAPATGDDARGTCSLRDAGQWRSLKNLSLAECADALEATPVDNDAGRLGQAYWRGTFLATSRSAIYRSADGRDWSLLRERRSP